MSHTTEQKCPQEKICGYEYTVKRGDSFYLIAQRLGVPLRDLLEANSEINPARLMVGDVLCVPMEEDDAVKEPAQEQQTKPMPAPTPAPSPEPTVPPSTATEQLDPLYTVCPEENRYTVAEGETVADIQQASDLSLKTLQAANPGVDLNALSGGETLCIPNGNLPCGNTRFYRMNEQDTLERLALQLDVSVGALLRANPCLAPTDFKAGTVIGLP